MTKQISGKKIGAAAAVLALSAALLAGCSSDSVSYQEKSYDVVGGEAQAVVIDVKDREIELTESEDGGIHLSYFESDKEGYSISLSEDKILTMVPANQKEWTDYVGGKADQEKRTIRLSLPSGALQSLKMMTSNEDIIIPALAVEDSVQLTVNGGNIRLAGLEAGSEIFLEAKNGNITGTLAGSENEYTIVSKAHKGKTNLPESWGSGAKTLNAATNNGDVDLAFED